MTPADATIRDNRRRLLISAMLQAHAATDPAERQRHREVAAKLTEQLNAS